MGFGEFILAIVLITSVSEVIKTFARRPASGGKKASKELVSQIDALREELRQVRRENHDAVLSFDSTLRHLDQRIAYLEGRTRAGEEREPAVGLYR
jgi:prephenate dehydrogenase